MQTIQGKTEQSCDGSMADNIQKWQLGANYRLEKFRGEGSYG